ncbi:MAG: DUF3426 domain-containing protein [Desulfatiglandales bacterium]
MIVECERCDTKFRLDENLLKATGSKVRCCICQHKFILFPPETEPQIEEGPIEKLKEPSTMPSDFDKTLVGEILEKPEAMSSEEAPKEEDLVSDYERTLAGGIEEEISQEEEELEPISFEDLSQLDSGVIKGKKEEKREVDRAMDRAARLEEDIRAQEELEREEAERVREVEEAFRPSPVIKKRYRPRLWLTILLIILILTVTASALIFFKPGFLPGSFPLFKKPISKEQAFDMGNRRLSFKDLNGSFVDSEKAGRLFMVKGLVTNNYPDRRSFIRIKSNILDSKGAIVRSKIVFAGNPISNKEIVSLSMEEINNRLNDKAGKDNMNTNTHPNASIPFMIIFENLPEDMSEFTVEAISSSPAGK